MPKRMSALDRAQRELEAELRDGGSPPAVEELARSQRLLAEALNKSKRLRRAADEAEDEEEDEVSEQQEDDEDEEDEEEDEDQDPDDPDEGTGRDDLRGTVGRKKAAKSRRRREVRKARPKWAGDEEDEDEEDDEREDAFEDVEAGGNGAYAGRGRKGYYRNEDANHQEDEEVPPDGPDVADGDDEDVYTIGAHKVHSERAMRRSKKSREAVYRSFARVPGAGEAIEAEPFLANLVDTTATLAERLEKSARSQGETRDLVRALIPAVATLSKAVAKLSKDMEIVKSQPVTSGTPWGVPVFSGKPKKGATPLAKSRADLIATAEGLLRSGQMDSRTFQALGGAVTAEDMAAILTPDQRQALGLGGVQ